MLMCWILWFPARSFAGSAELYDVMQIWMYEALSTSNQSEQRRAEITILDQRLLCARQDEELARLMSQCNMCLFCSQPNPVPPGDPPTGPSQGRLMDGQNIMPQSHGAGRPHIRFVNIFLGMELF